MTAKISSSLPKGDRNGLGSIMRVLVDHPQRLHVLLAVVDCKSITTDNDTGDIVPTARIRHVEAVAVEDLAAAKRLMDRAIENRNGSTMLPMEVEDELIAAFSGVDPSTGEFIHERDQDGGEN